MSNNNWKQMRTLMWVQIFLLALIVLTGCSTLPEACEGLDSKGEAYCVEQHIEKKREIKRLEREQKEACIKQGMIWVEDHRPYGKEVGCYSREFLQGRLFQQ